MSWEIWDSLGIHSPGQIEGLDTSLLKSGWIDSSVIQAGVTISKREQLQI